MPVEPATLGTFVLAVLALVLSPGPDTLVILRHSLTSGRAVGLAAVAGVQIGLAFHTLLAVLGVSVVIASSPVLFRAIGIAGALYLGWIGLQGMRQGGLAALQGDGPKAGAVKAWREALLTNLLNPKVVVMFLALFPNFVDRDRPDTTAQLLTLSATLIVINTLWQMSLPVTAGALRRVLADPRAQRGASVGTGAVLLALGLVMLYEHLH